MYDAKEKTAPDEPPRQQTEGVGEPQLKSTARDEFLRRQIEDARGLYRGLAVVYALIVLAAIVMAVICPFVGKAEAIIELIGFAAGAGTAAYLSWGQYRDYAEALAEIDQDPTGAIERRPLSKKTVDAIAEAHLSKKELLQQWIAYGLITLTLIFFGGLNLAFYILGNLDGELVLLGVGAGMLAGGALMGYLTAKAFHSWLIARRLPKD